MSYNYGTWLAVSGVMTEVHEAFQLGNKQS